MSAAFLGDKVGWRRWLAIVVGFGGALIVIQPSFVLFGWTALLPVACAFLYSIYLFMNRALGDADFGRHVAQPGARVEREADQHVGMIAQEGPLPGGWN